MRRAPIRSRRAAAMVRYNNTSPRNRLIFRASARQDHRDLALTLPRACLYKPAIAQLAAAAGGVRFYGILLHVR
jgi:hypothetical protein